MTALELLAVNTAERRFTLLCDAHYRAILGYLVRCLDSMVTAQDLTEDVFLIAWRRLDQVPAAEEGGYWLYGVARRVLANHHRKTARRRGITQRFLVGEVSAGNLLEGPDVENWRSSRTRTSRSARTRTGGSSHRASRASLRPEIAS